MTHRHALQIAHQAIDVIPRLMALMANEARHSDLRAVANHIGVLHVLQHHSYTISELAEEMEVSSASMTKTLTTFEERGWVKRIRSDIDRRSVHVESTPEGHSAYLSLKSKVAERLATVFDQFTPEQLEQIATTFTLLSRSFEDERLRDPPP